MKRTRHPVRRARAEQALLCPPLPPALDYLWRAFSRMRRRKGGGFGPQPLDYADIEAFQRLACFTFTPWEIGLLEDLDDLLMVDYSARQIDINDES